MKIFNKYVLTTKQELRNKMKDFLIWERGSINEVSGRELDEIVEKLSGSGSW